MPGFESEIRGDAACSARPRQTAEGSVFPLSHMLKSFVRVGTLKVIDANGVEHVFAAQKCRLGLVVRTVGMARARVKIGLANLTYNFRRLVWLNE